MRDGTYRIDRHGPIPAELIDVRPERSMLAPSELDAWGRSVWRETYPAIAGRGILTESDRGTFVMYCVSYGTFLNACDEIRKTGLVREVITPAEGNKPEKKILTLSAWYTIRREALADATKCASLLGLTPVDRGRVMRVDIGIGATAKSEGPKKTMLTGSGPIMLNIANAEEDD